MADMDTYNFPYSRSLNGDLGYMIMVFKELESEYNNVHGNYELIKSACDVLESNLSNFDEKENADYVKLVTDIAEFKTKLDSAIADNSANIRNCVENSIQLNTLDVNIDALTGLEKGNEHGIKVVRNTDSSNVVKANSVNTDFTAIDSKNTVNDERLTQIESNISGNTKDIATTTTEMLTLDSRIESLEDSNIAEIISDIKLSSSIPSTSEFYTNFIKLGKLVFLSFIIIVKETTKLEIYDSFSYKDHKKQLQLLTRTKLFDTHASPVFGKCVFYEKQNIINVSNFKKNVSALTCGCCDKAVYENFNNIKIVGSGLAILE